MPNGCRVRFVRDTGHRKAGREENLPTAMARRFVELGAAEFVNEINYDRTPDNVSHR
jgi:hypothetical protein